MIKCEGFCSVDVLWGMTSGRRFFVSLSFRGQRREEERTKKVGCFSIGNWQPNCLAYLPLYGDDDDNFYDYDNDQKSGSLALFPMHKRKMFLLRHVFLYHPIPIS